MSNCLVLCKGFRILPHEQCYNAISQKEITIGALALGRGFAELKDLRVAHVGDQLLRLLVERVNLFGLLQVLQEKNLVRVTLELLNQLFLTVSLRFVSCCWTAE